jgi:hypothetical protein
MRLLPAVLLFLPVAAALGSSPEPQAWTLDDFENGEHVSAHGLAWIGLGDDLMGGNSSVVLERVAGGANGTGHALRVKGNVGDKAPAFTGAWVPLEGGARPVDLGAFEAIRFKARGEGAFQAGLRRGPATSSTNFMAPFAVGPEWKTIEIPFETLKPIGPGAAGAVWSTQEVHWLGIGTATGSHGAFHLDVDDVELVSHRSGARPSPVAQAGPARAVRLSSPAPPAGGDWRELGSDPAGDGKNAALPDATSVAVLNASDGRVWFRVRLRDAVPEHWLGVNLVLDTDGDPANGMEWWGVNKAFHFDRLVSVWLFRTGDAYQGVAGIADAAAVTAGDFMASGNDVAFSVQREPSAFLVGVPRSALGSGTAPLRLVLAVGSAFMHNDDVPDTGALSLAR